MGVKVVKLISAKVRQQTPTRAIPKLVVPPGLRPPLHVLVRRRPPRYARPLGAYAADVVPFAKSSRDETNDKGKLMKYLMQDWYVRQVTITDR
jgi:hypothetical protein